MGFTARQTIALRRNLDSRYIRTREAHGRALCARELDTHLMARACR
jgi:hypothetical protein